MPLPLRALWIGGLSRLLLFRGPPDEEGFPRPDMPDALKELTYAIPLELNRAVRQVPPHAHSSLSSPP